MKSPRASKALVVLLAGWLCSPAVATAQTPFAAASANPSQMAVAASRQPLNLQDGERILFVGDALMWSELENGYIESHLQARFPGRKPISRNLAWREDGLLSAGGGDRMDRLQKSIEAYKPGLVIVGYGMGGSLTNKTDPDAFVKEVSLILDAAMTAGGEARPRWALVGPVPRETNGLADTNATAHNIQLKLYENRLRDLALKRDGVFVPLFDKFAQPALATRGITPLTRDSIHPNAYGCARIAEAVEMAFSLKPNMWRIGFTAEGRLREDNWGVKVQDLSVAPERASWTALLDHVPGPVIMGRTRPMTMLSPPCLVAIPNLNPGDYKLKIDGRAVSTNSHRAWAAGEIVFRGAPFEQAENLRLAIVERNRAWSRILGEANPASSAAALFTREDLQELDRKIHRLAAPLAHRFDITPLR